MSNMNMKSPTWSSKIKMPKIRELQGNLARAQFVISFLEKENKHLSEKQVLLEMELLKAKRQDVKGKSVITDDESDEDEA